MEENNKHKSSDELFRSRFESAGIEPPSKAWDEIEKRLDEKNKRPAYIYWLSGIALLLIVGCGIYFSTINSSSSEKIASTTKLPANLDGIAKDKNVPSEINSTENSSVKNSKNEIPLNVDASNTSAKNNLKNEKLNSSNENSTSLENKKTSIEKSDTNDGVAKAKLDNEPKIASTKKVSNIQKQLTTTSSLDLSLSNYEKTKDEKSKSNILATNSGSKSPLSNELEKTNEVQEKPIEEVKIGEKSNSNAIKSNEENKLAESEKKEVQEIKKADSILQISSNSLLKTDSLIASKDTIKKEVTVASSEKKKIDENLPAVNPNLLRNSLSIYFSPDYYESIIKDNSGQNVADEIQMHRFTSGIKYEYFILDKLSVRVGVAYSEIQNKFENHQIVFGRFITEPFVFYSSLGEMLVDPNIMREDFAPPSATFPSTFKFDYNYSQSVKFINIPLEAKFKHNIKKFGFAGFVGVNTQIVIQQQAQLNLLKENLTNTITYTNLNMNKTSFAGIAGFGFEYRMTKRISIFVEPHFRMNFTDLNKSSQVKSTPYFIGANAGLSFSF